MTLRSIPRRARAWGAALVTSLGLALAGAAQAGLITTSQVQSFSGSTLASELLGFDGFDASLGRLVQVGIEVSSSAYRSVVIQADCTQSTVACSQSGGGSVIADLPAFTLGSISLVAHDMDSARSSCTAAAGSSRNCLLPLVASYAVSDVATDEPTLLQFTGLGRFDLTLTQSLATRFDGMAKVTYVYEELATVAEPAMLANFGLGLAALASARRRRR